MKLMIYKIATFFAIFVVSDAFAQSYFANSTSAVAPVAYTAIELKEVRGGNKIVPKIKEIWQDMAKEISPELRKNMHFYAYEIKHENDKVDIITMFYAPSVCGMHQCPLRVVTFDRGKLKILLDTFSIFAPGYKAYAVGPKDKHLHRNIFASGLYANTIWSYNEEKSTYVREDK